jgi:hypothetical protein
MNFISDCRRFTSAGAFHLCYLGITGLKAENWGKEGKKPAFPLHHALISLPLAHARWSSAPEMVT